VPRPGAHGRARWQRCYGRRRQVARLTRWHWPQVTQRLDARPALGFGFARRNQRLAFPGAQHVVGGRTMSLRRCTQREPPWRHTQSRRPRHGSRLVDVRLSSAFVAAWCDVRRPRRFDPVGALEFGFRPGCRLDGLLRRRRLCGALRRGSLGPVTGSERVVVLAGDRGGGLWPLCPERREVRLEVGVSRSRARRCARRCALGGVWIQSTCPKLLEVLLEGGITEGRRIAFCRRRIGGRTGC
jgi:hypothetical protein